MISKDDVIKLGFKPIPHFTIMDSHIYNLGRNRQLSISSIGTPNEMLYINEVDNDDDDRVITECICLHNYDYDGYITIDKIKSLIELIDYKGRY